MSAPSRREIDSRYVNVIEHPCGCETAFDTLFWRSHAFNRCEPHLRAEKRGREDVPTNQPPITPVQSSSPLVWNGSRSALVAALAAELETRHGRVERWADVIVTKLFDPNTPAHRP